MIVKPAEGLRILDPETMSPLPAEGLPKTDGDLHWARLARDGDVTLHDDPTPDAAPASSKGATDR